MSSKSTTAIPQHTLTAAQRLTCTPTVQTYPTWPYAIIIWCITLLERRNTDVKISLPRCFNKVLGNFTNEQKKTPPWCYGERHYTPTFSVSCRSSKWFWKYWLFLKNKNGTNLPSKSSSGTSWRLCFCLLFMEIWTPNHNGLGIFICDPTPIPYSISGM